MSCTACGSGGRTVQRQTIRQKAVVESQDCVYTTEQMVIWKEKLECAKTKNIFAEIGFSKYKINFAIGTVQSTLNTGSPCTFQKELDKIYDIILAIINTNQC